MGIGIGNDAQGLLVGHLHLRDLDIDPRRRELVMRDELGRLLERLDKNLGELRILS